MSLAAEQRQKLASNTLEQRGHLLASTVLGNLHRMVSAPCSFREGMRQWDESIALVCGAGPSLDHTLAVLAGTRHDVVLFPITACAERVAHDLPGYDSFVVGCEALPAHDVLADVCDLQAHARLWRGHTRWSLAPDMAGHHVASHLGVPVLESGGASVLVALATARAMGFRRIVLTGVDLVLDGECYAPGTGWHGMTARVGDDGALSIVGRADRDELHEEHVGHAPPREFARPIEVLRVDGRIGRTTLDYADQADWLAGFARHRAGETLINLGRGALLSGWHHATPDAIDWASSRRQPVLGCGDAVERARMLRFIDAEIERTQAHERASSATGPHGRLADLARGDICAFSPFIEMRIGGVIGDVKRRVAAGTMRPHDAFEVVRQATTAAAEITVELLEQQRVLVARE